LHAAFYGKNGTKIAWSAYRVAYLREMRSSKAAIQKLVDLINSGNTITLLCSSACVHDGRCHRSLLREIIMAKMSTHLAA
jgi:uncharacterized protein YeaO (DUF488 family)